MSVFVDRKFLGMISFKLDRFTQKNSDLYNFRCPYCLDSKKNKVKSRGYVYRRENDYFYRCHNCGVSTTFGRFLEHVDNSAYKQYVMERYTEGKTGITVNTAPDFSELKGNAFDHFKKLSEPKTIDLENISQLPENHYARDYILRRSIPPRFWNEIYYTEHFKDFMDRNFPDHGKEDVPNDDRIVLLFTNEHGDITNISGRALGDVKMRYITIKVSDEKKLFGTHRVDKSKRVTVVEGQFDSFFLDNCVATGDSNLAGASSILGSEVDVVLVFDNEKRNKEIVRQIEWAIEDGHKVCIFPDDIQEKDINDMVRAGIDVQAVIDANLYQGLSAMMHFSSWRKCK